MAQWGPIVFVEDDIDDQEFMREVMQHLQVKNELIFFTKATDALEFLKSKQVQPMMIFSDVNLPMMNGLEFKRAIDTDPELRARSIPFVFLSTSVAKSAVDEAFREMSVQGFFEKTASLPELENILGMIINYWKMSHHPNNS